MSRCLVIKISFLFCFILFASIGIAQLCTGSLGDPAVNITFGSGSNPGPPLPAATINYQYASNPCPVNGFYSVLNSGINCNYGWHVLSSDHTGNPNGYFMLVDGSFEPSDFYLDTVKSLCANTTYEFAAWMLNMKNIPQGIRPDIIFSVETTNGVVLQTYNTGTIPVEQVVTWRQYGFYFTTPANISDVVLRMTNKAPGGDGNDLALDDITFRPCGPIITSFIQSHGDTLNVCEDDTGMYIFSGDSASAYLEPVYQWQVSTNMGNVWKDIAGAGLVTYLRKPTGIGVYWYRLAVVEKSFAANIKCRTASQNLVINVHAKPFVNAGSDRIIFVGDTINLNATVTGESPTWQWTPPNGLSDMRLLKPIASPLANIQYTLYAQTSFGCKNNDAVSVKVVENVFVPTAFTPNNDGLNDRWHIPYLDPILNAAVSVYNRYGQRVYYSEGTAVAWDGTLNEMPQATGVYIYHIVFKKGRRAIKGTFMLIK